MRFNAQTPQTISGSLVPEGSRLAGYAALVYALEVEAPLQSQACVSNAHVKESVRRSGPWQIFDKRYWPGEALGDHLTFALKHEPIDLLSLKRILEKADVNELKAFILSTPGGTANRRIWFFYETLTGQQLDIPDAGPIPFVDALDPKAYFTVKPILSKRHRVRNNLLGDGSFCPVIRRTEALGDFARQELGTRAATIIGRTGRHLLARAASFLLLADSRASFEIEGVRAPKNRLERWGRAVLQAGKKPLAIDEIIRLHGVLIEDARFIQIGLRSDGVYLGERDHNNDPLPEFIGARPDDLQALMAGLIAANNRMSKGGLDPVLQAAATAFGFVFIHPLEDGNGRLHRCLIHHVLAERKFSPPGMVFPVSAVMQDRIDEYRNVLQAHSGPLMEFIDWKTTANRNVDVKNDTGDLYRYFDCTEVAEFLYACVRRTIEEDLPKEIDYLLKHDEALERIMNAIDLPDRLAQDFIMFVLQNGGALSKRRRNKEFEALTDGEVEELVKIVNDTFEDDLNEKV